MRTDRLPADCPTGAKIRFSALTSRGVRATARPPSAAPCLREARQVDKYQTVAFDSNRYSVPRPWAFQAVTVKGYVDRIEVVAQGQVIAQHQRSYASGQQILDPRHYLATLGRKRVRFFTAVALVNKLEQAQKQYQLERLLTQLDKTDLLVCDELGYLSSSRSGAELLFQVFADRYERASLLVTSNLHFSEWHQVFQGERMTAVLRRGRG